MKIFLIIATFIGLIVSLQAQSIIYITGVDAAGDDNDGAWYLTYQAGTYDSFESTIESNNLPFWGNDVDALAFASGTVSIPNGGSLSGIRFAYLEATFSGTPTVVYYDQTSQGQVFQDATSNYVINVSRVPAPLPILGILPVVGFLKRMRRRQRTS